MATGGAFSDTLRSITNAKLSELSRKRDAFNEGHFGILHTLQAQADPLVRLVTLLEGVKHCFGIETRVASDSSNLGQSEKSQQLEDDLLRLGRFLEQAKFDPSLSGSILLQWEKTLLQHLDVESRRYQYATLYGQLVKEWLYFGTRRDTTANEPSADSEMGDGFEEIPDKKRLEARKHFQNLVFTSPEVDGATVKDYLEAVFQDEEASSSKHTRNAITHLRESTQKFEAQLAAPNRFNIQNVRRSITGLLKGDLLRGDKRTILRSFLNSTIILSEIADVLNMRMSTISTWSWGNEGIPVEHRRKANGSFDVFMHGDLLQAIFLQFIGVEWSVFFKTAFGRFRRAAWKSNFKQISRVERRRREYYLGPQETDQSLARRRRRTYRKGYFVHQLLSSPEQEIETKDGEEEAGMAMSLEEEDEEQPQIALMSEAAAFSAPMMKRSRKVASVSAAQRDDEESDDDTAENFSPKKPMERKQALLHLLATEMAVNKRVHGSFTAFRAVFEDLHNSMPHQSIIAVLEFLGVSNRWLNFFTEFLEAPMRSLEDQEDPSLSKKRERGAPASHTLTDVLSETMLFCVDYSINRRTDGNSLHRLADDLWFWSHDHGKAMTAWKELQGFAKTMGLAISKEKSGSVSTDEQGRTGTDALPAGRIRWGMTYFDPDTLRFSIDQKMVDEHISELKRQLAAKDSIFDWIQGWNAYADTFFASNFGKSANCFGRDQVDEILETHQRIQRTVFDGKDVAQHLKAMIEKRFDVRDLADGFLYFPVELGGLELQSPFVAPLQIRDNISKTPSGILDEFEENEKQEYQDRKADFDNGNDPSERDDIDNRNWRPSEGADEFMPFEEYIKYREEFTTSGSENFLLAAYEQLMQMPVERSIEASPSVLQALERLREHTHARGITHEWYMMDAYWKWIAQLYGPEMIEHFGGLSVVDAGLLPIGMVGLFRDQKVNWQ